jgi:stage V sporulation protein AD
MAFRIGKSTIELSNCPVIVSAASIAGKKESEGPLGQCFDVILRDDLWDEQSWEKTESKMFRECVRTALDKAGKKPDDVDCLFGGDLLNQIISASFAARDLSIPFAGIYSACATFAQSIAMASFMIESGSASTAACAATSHFDTAERQYRYPLELGSQRTPTAQRTVTGAGAVILAQYGKGPAVRRIVMGKVTDWKIKDTENMGAAMAPAAAETIAVYLEDTGESLQGMDAIVTGDLGCFGSELLLELMVDHGHDISSRHMDCGTMIYPHEEGLEMGGSGCGCSASVFCGYLYTKLSAGEYERILFVPTGALLSPTSALQGESIPGIAHAILVENMQVE